MTETHVIEYLEFVVPAVTGTALAMIGLAKKYPTVFRYVSTSWSAWAYVLLSAGGSVLVTVSMRAIGTRLMYHGVINCISEGVLGSALFLGIMSKVSISKASTDEVESSATTIKEYIFEFLDDSIARRVMQRVEARIKGFGKSINEELFLKEASRLIGGPEKLTAEQKQDLRIRFDEYASRGDYATIVRTLIMYYEVEYVMDELSGCILEDPRVLGS